MLCFVVQKRQLDHGHFLTSRHHSWNDHPCRNLREPLQDIRARDFQWLSDFFSRNICEAKLRSILFLFLFTSTSSYQAFFVCHQRQTWIYPIKCDRYCQKLIVQLSIQFGINCSASNQSEASIYGSSIINSLFQAFSWFQRRGNNMRQELLAM